jgi:hydroxyethylthiazole kinase
MFAKINQLLTKMRQERPLVLNLTNDVTMDMIANGLLSLGASPVMSQAQEDIEDLIPLAKSVVINLGTLDTRFLALCERACQLANEHHKPIILDPVGAGATRYRTEAAKKFISHYQIAIVRGNASEIMALADLTAGTKGVDSIAQSHQAIKSAESLSKNEGVAVLVSGKEDIIVDGKQIARFDRGSPLMPTVIGTGCLLSSVVGAFHAIEPERFAAASAAAVFYAVCGEMAADQAEGPGSFKTLFLDALYQTPTQAHYENA